MSIADQIANIKTRHDVATSFLANARFNHPNRLAGVSFSGLLSYVIDERSFTSPGTSASKYDFSLDYNASNIYTRIFEEYFPWAGDTPPAGTPAQGDFLMFQRQGAGMWSIDTLFGTDTSAVVIGTVDTKVYSRPTTSDPFTENSSTTTNISHRFSLFISGGGDPVSGNFSTLEAAKTTTTCLSFHSGTHSGLIPELEGLIFRFPHEDLWSSETTLFSDAFTAHLALKNTADGGGHSGTCSISLNYTL